MKFQKVFALAVLSIAPMAHADPAASPADSYRMGVQSYNSKDYPQAIQYFNQTIQAEPANARAYQHRGDCYYAQGQYSKAVEDYQQALSLNPSNTPLAAFIEKLKGLIAASGGGAPAAPTPAAFPASNAALLASPTPSPAAAQAGNPVVAPSSPAPVASANVPPAASPAPAGDPYQQGLSLFQQNQYASAVPFFQQATQQNPRDPKAYYYLGISQVRAGDNKDGALALAIYDKMNPSPQVGTYVSRLKLTLTPDEQKWVEGQLAAFSAPASTASKPPEKGGVSLGIRLESAAAMFTPDDLNSEARAGQTFAQLFQALDASAAFAATVPGSSVHVGLEPVLNLGPNLELGLPIAYGIYDTTTETFSSNSGNLSQTFSMTEFSIGFNARYFILGGEFRPFVAGGPLVIPATLTYQYAANSSSSSFDAMGIGLGAQVQFGMDWHVDETFVVSPSVGYQVASIDSFSGSSSGGNEEVYIFSQPVAGHWPIIGVAPSGSLPSGARPLQLDLSGPHAGLIISAFF